MGQRIVIDPVTRIEGHAKITLHLDDQGEVSDARFHVIEFRGFEKFCEGRSFREMPGITSRICGICPVSHLLTSAKAGDDLLAVEIPEGAVRLRRLLNLGQIVQSHALSFFHLSSPDFLLGYDSDPAKRNVFGLIEENPEIARRGIRLRKFGQEVIETLAGTKIHSTWVVPGGVDEPLTAAGRDRIAAWLPEAKESIEKTLTFLKREMDRHQDEARVFGNFPSLFMGLVTPDGGLEHYDGKIRFVDATGAIVADQLDAAVPRVHRRGGRALVLPQVPLLQAARLPRRDVPRGAARPAQRGLPLRHAPRRPRARRVPAARARRRPLRLPLPLRPPHRDPLRLRADRGDPRRPRPADRRTCSPSPAATATRASAAARPRAAPSSTTTR